MRSPSCLILLALALISLTLGSCRTVRTVPVETVRTDTAYISLTRWDSIHVRDSVTLTLKGDTVWRDRWRTEYRDRRLTDTVYIHRSDTVTVIREVERELQGWDKFRYEAGGVAIALLVLAVAAGAVFLVIKVRK